jgi:aminopeptidase N
MLHTIRQLVDDDARWRDVLRGLNREFRWQTVTAAQVEEYIAREGGVDLAEVFDQYVRTAMIPILEYRLAGRTLSYRWTNVVPGFAMPVRATLERGETTWLRPTEQWQTVETRLASAADFEVDEDFYVQKRLVSATN